jgi:phage tail sheath protein FI
MEEINFTKDLTLGVFVGSLSGGVYVKPDEQDFYPDYDTVTGAAKGMAMFENTEARILGCAEIFTVNFIRECRDLCEKLKRFFVFNAPYLATEQVAEQYNNVLVGSDASFVAGYLNWGEVMDGSSKVWIPCLGYVLGAGYVRKSEMQNGYAWIPPAGVETTSRGFLRMTHSDLTDAQINRYVVGFRMNVVRYITNVGNIIWSSRTFSANPLFESIHIRLMTNWLVEMLPIRNQRFLQRLGTPSLIKEIYADNYVFMRDIYEKGGIENSLDFEESCVINVEIDKNIRKEVDLEISWIPTECTEAIRIKLNRNDGVLLLNN